MADSREGQYNGANFYAVIYSRSVQTLFPGDMCGCLYNAGVITGFDCIWIESDGKVVGG